MIRSLWSSSQEHPYSEHKEYPLVIHYKSNLQQFSKELLMLLAEKETELKGKNLGKKNQ